jgi:pyridoxamine 5'-phosphate oxidase
MKQEPAPSTVLGLRKSDLHSDPLHQFDQWFKHALDSNLPEPTAMTLATASPHGAPSARIVLLKRYDERGFAFFTNYLSQKGRDLDANPRAALVFFWPSLERQIRISGTVGRTSVSESELYFHSRPRGSRIGAWASEQSQVLSCREEFDRKVQDLTLEYEGKDIPLPPHWGGYILAPNQYEFWQARINRLHDRFLYTPAEKNAWKLVRLSP